MDAILQLDQNILLFIQEYIRHDWMDWFWKGITHLGDFGTYYRNTDHKCGDKECGCQNKAV